MVVNDSGQVALKYTISENGKTVKIDGTPRFYVFTSKLHIPMAWVNKEDAPRLLANKQKTCNCANGVYKNAFVYANILDVNLFMNGDRYGSPDKTYQEIENE